MKNRTTIFYFAIAFSAFTACNNDTTEEEKLNGLDQGKVKQETVTVASKIAGRIEKVLVTEGTAVRQGDTLAIISVPELQPKLLQAQGAIESAEGQLNLAVNGATNDQVAQVQAQVDAANSQLDFAQQTYNRMENMYADSLISAQQFDEVKSKLRSARAQVRTLQAKKQEVIKGARPENIQAARGQVIRAQGARSEVLQADKERYIIAPADMVVETISLKQNELATPGYTIFNGYVPSSTYFRFTISESKINAYQPGQSVTILVPYTNKSIAAKISSIKQLARYADNTSTAPTYKLGESIYELKIVPANPNDAVQLYANSTVLIEKIKKP